MVAGLTYVALVGHLKGASPGNLVEVGQVLFLVGNQVAVQVVVQVRLWDLVSHGNCIWDEFHDCAGHCTHEHTQEKTRETN